jgi:aminopeptidase N
VADPARPFVNTGAVYYKGARAVHMLRRLVSDATFFPALRAYGDAHAWGTASRADLRGDFEKASGLDLKQFFDQWVETPFRPVLRATFQTALDASSVTLTVTQAQGHTVVHPIAAPGDKPFYVFPLVVRLTYLDGTTLDVTVNLDGAAPTTTVAVPNPSRKFVAGIALDPEKDLLRIVESTGPA